MLPAAPQLCVGLQAWQVRLWLSCLGLTLSGWCCCPRSAGPLAGGVPLLPFCWLLLQTALRDPRSPLVVAALGLLAVALIWGLASGGRVLLWLHFFPVPPDL